MKTLQKTDVDGVVHLLPAVSVTVTEHELEWLIEAIDHLILPDRSKRLKRALRRAETDLLKSVSDYEEGADSEPVETKTEYCARMGFDM